ncbi:hypothetical protein [Bacillus atrophaeus]
MSELAFYSEKYIAALVKGEIETPNDISGVVYIAMDEHDGWKIKIIKELRNAGYNVNSETIFIELIQPRF